MVKLRVYACRALLALLVPAAAALAFHPTFRPWHLMPYAWLYRNGVSHASVLWFERNLGSMLHFLVAIIFLLLIPAARLVPGAAVRGQRWFAAVLLVAAGGLVEAYQWAFTARGFDLKDLAFQALGMAVVAGLWWLGSLFATESA